MSAPSGELHTRTATELLELLEARQVSSVALTKTAIARIEAMDGRINAVICRRFEEALREAERADTSRARGEHAPLLGIPMTVKESYNVAGLPTNWGSADARDWMPAENAAAIARLRAAGAIILGKTNVPVMLDDWQAYNPIYGTTNNPWDLTRTPGGSSGGSAAALAAGYVPLEMGSDIGGSLRVPAHFCGVFAHAPSLNLVPVRGHAPARVPALPRDSDLAVIGPMARSAADLALLLGIVAGPDGPAAKGYRLDLPRPRFTTLADARVIIVSEHPLVPVGRDVAACIDAFAERLAPEIRRISRDAALLPDLATGARAYMRLLSSGFGADMPDERYAEHRQQAADIAADDESLRAMRLRGITLSHRDWIRSDRIRIGFRDRWSRLFRDWDLVLCPIFSVPAFPHDHGARPRTLAIDGRPTDYDDQLAWAGISTFPGLPATALPIGMSPEGLPIGIQAIGPFLEDHTPLTFARLVTAGCAFPPL